MPVLVFVGVVFSVEVTTVTKVLVVPFDVTWLVSELDVLDEGGGDDEVVVGGGVVVVGGGSVVVVGGGGVGEVVGGGGFSVEVSGGGAVVGGGLAGLEVVGSVGGGGASSIVLDVSDMVKLFNFNLGNCLRQKVMLANGDVWMLGNLDNGMGGGERERDRGQRWDETAESMHIWRCTEGRAARCRCGCSAARARRESIRRESGNTTVGAQQGLGLT